MQMGAPVGQSRDERRVVAAAMDETDLRSLVYWWEPEWDGSSAPNSRNSISDAVSRVVKKGLVELYPAVHPPVDRPLALGEVEETLQGFVEWSEQGQQKNVWLVLTRSGQIALSKLSQEELAGGVQEQP